MAIASASAAMPTWRRAPWTDGAWLAGEGIVLATNYVGTPKALAWRYRIVIVPPRAP
jgi:hypothetical protein